MSLFEKIYIVGGLAILIIIWVCMIQKCSACESNGKQAVREFGHLMPVCADVEK